MQRRILESRVFGAAAGQGTPGNRADPFDLKATGAYRRWRAAKLEDYPRRAEELIVEIADLGAPSPAERAEVLRLCAKTGMAIYASRSRIESAEVLPLARQFGLRRLDRPLHTGAEGVTEICLTETGPRSGYRPYSDRPLNWHSDGYYAVPEAAVRGVILHCRRPALSGGTLTFYDPEIAYIRLRDENPAYLTALARPDVLTIPANRSGGRTLRGTCSGPVLSCPGGALHLRYTARKRYAIWKDDPLTRAAKAFLERMLEEDREFHFVHRLEAGQGVISNNVLHRRDAFRDAERASERRLIYRARFLDRVGEGLDGPVTQEKSSCPAV